MKEGRAFITNPTAGHRAAPPVAVAPVEELQRGLGVSTADLSWHKGAVVRGLEPLPVTP